MSGYALRANPTYKESDSGAGPTRKGSVPSQSPSEPSSSAVPAGAVRRRCLSPKGEFATSAGWREQRRGVVRNADDR